MILVCFVEGAIMMPIAIALAITCVAVIIVPMYIVQTYRLFKIIGLQCCKTNDLKKKRQ